MKSLSSYLITIAAVLYWGFRVIVSFLWAIGKEFICQPLDTNIEIAILFLTIPSFILIIRRNLVAATLYFGMYAAYFGTIVYNSLVLSAPESQTLSLTDTTSIFISALGVIIPFLVFCDILIQKGNFSSEYANTQWYYKEKKYNRQFDSRADRNQYKIK